MIFDTIKNISLTSKGDYDNKIFLTFDIDWVPDEVLAYTLDIIEEHDIPATFFATHETSLLERFRRNPKIELGIHPNFNPLLQGEFSYGKNFKEVIAHFKAIVPNAVSARSHSMTQQSFILGHLTQCGITHECNCFIPWSGGITLKPWLLWDKQLLRVPYFWEDDIHCIYGWQWDYRPFLKQKGLKVFDFHPINVFLNTETIDRYMEARDYQSQPGELSRFVNTDNYGTRDFLMDIIAVVGGNG